MLLQMSAALTGLAVLDDDGVEDLAVLAETIMKGIVSGVPGETSDEKLGRPRSKKKRKGDEVSG